MSERLEEARRRPTPRERSSFLSFYFQHGGGEGLGKGQEEARRRPTPRERSSFLSSYFQHGGGEGLGEGQEEANTQGEVVIPVILFSAWRRRGIG